MSNKFKGKYAYAHPEHKKTCFVEARIQAMIANVEEKHGAAVIGDTSKMRHFTLCFGITGDTKVLEVRIKEVVASLLEKHGKNTFSIHVERFMFCPGAAPIVAVAPKADSVDWKFFTELQATLLMDPTLNAAHPDYKGDNKIIDPTLFPAGFADLKADIDSGTPFDDAAHRWMWPHMSAMTIRDKEIGGFGTLNREALETKYGWICDEKIDAEIPIRAIGASVELDGQKFRLEFDI